MDRWTAWHGVQLFSRLQDVQSYFNKEKTTCNSALVFKHISISFLKLGLFVSQQIGPDSVHTQVGDIIHLFLEISNLTTIHEARIKVVHCPISPRELVANIGADLAWLLGCSDQFSVKIVSFLWKCLLRWASFTPTKAIAWLASLLWTTFQKYLGAGNWVSERRVWEKNRGCSKVHSAFPSKSCTKVRSSLWILGRHPFHIMLSIFKEIMTRMVPKSVDRSNLYQQTCYACPKACHSH